MSFRFFHEHPLTPRDRDRVAEIYAEAQTASPAPIGPKWTRDQLNAELELGVGWWEAEDSAALSAFILYRNLPDAIEITMLATASNSRRRGTMGELLGALQRLAAQNSVRPKAIWLEVHELNVPARKLYEKSGFREVGRRPRYYADNGAAILYNWG